MAYTRLTPEERDHISVGLASGLNQTEIARRLKCHRSTISREIRRHLNGEDGYSAVKAQERANKLARCHHRQRKLAQNPALWRFVQDCLSLRWSPEQISRTLKRRYPNNPMMCVSHETIYTYVYVQSRGALKKELVSYLRQKRKQRRPRSRGVNGRGSIPEMISIDQRPPEVADRTVPGHWEGDLIMGAGNASALGSLVERTTRFLLLVKLRTHDVVSVRKAFTRVMKKLPEHLRLSLTYDQGKEMAEHRLFTNETKIKVYFAHPHSPWERGTNENTNGLVRDFFPKGTNFDEISGKYITWVQNALNDRPRKTLEWFTPREKFSTVMKKNNGK